MRQNEPARWVCGLKGQAANPDEFNPWNSHGRREQTPKGHPLTSTCTLGTHKAHMYIQIKINNYMYKKVNVADAMILTHPLPVLPTSKYLSVLNVPVVI